jgi:hypothetical protein
LIKSLLFYQEVRMSHLVEGGAFPPGHYSVPLAFAAAVVAANPAAANQLANRVGAMGQRVFGPLLTKVQGAVGDLAQKAVQRAHSLFSRKPQLASACSDAVFAQHPGAESRSRAAVEQLCANEHSELTIEGTFEPDGIKAICAALAQNTALTSLTIKGFCDTENLAEAVVAALKANKTLKRLDLAVSDTQVTNINPTPIRPDAITTLFQNLPCLSIEELSVGSATITMEAAQAFADALQTNPWFPLKELSFTWHEIQFTEDTFRKLMEGIAANRCLSGVMFGRYSSQTPEMASLLFGAMGQTRSISNMTLWCPNSNTFTAGQQNRIINATEENVCFLGYVVAEPWMACFPSALAEAIRNITQGREPCTRNETCDVKPNCIEPTVAPTLEPTATPTNAPTGAPTPNATDSVEASSANVVTDGIALPVSVAAVAGVGAIGAVAMFRRKRRQDPEQLSTVALQGNIPLRVEEVRKRVENLEQRVNNVEAGQDLRGAASSTSTLHGVQTTYVLNAATEAARLQEQALLRAAAKHRAAAGRSPTSVPGTALSEPAPQAVEGGGDDDETFDLYSPEVVPDLSVDALVGSAEQVSTDGVQLGEGVNPEETGDLQQPGEAEES